MTWTSRPTRSGPPLARPACQRSDVPRRVPGRSGSGDSTSTCKGWPSKVWKYRCRSPLRPTRPVRPPRALLDWARHAVGQGGGGRSRPRYFQTLLGHPLQVLVESPLPERPGTLLGTPTATRRRASGGPDRAGGSSASRPGRSTGGEFRAKPQATAGGRLRFHPTVGGIYAAGVGGNPLWHARGRFVTLPPAFFPRPINFRRDWRCPHQRCPGLRCWDFAGLGRIGRGGPRRAPVGKPAGDLAGRGRSHEAVHVEGELWAVADHGLQLLRSQRRPAGP